MSYFFSSQAELGIGLYYTVSQKTFQMFLAITRESIVGFS